MGAIFFIKLDNEDDFFDSSTFGFLAIGAEIRAASSGSRFKEDLLSVESFELDFRALTDLFHASLMVAIRSFIGTSLGVPAQILFFSTEPMAFPIPLSLTTDFVTGSRAILLSR